MKGIILAGGHATRLQPLTNVTNKHLLPIYDKPMIYYPLETLIKAGVKDILLVTGKDHCGSFTELLGSGENLGIDLTYKIQERPGGIAQALGLARKYVNDDSVAVVLGDNIVEDTLDFKDFTKGARVYLKEVPDPERFGVAEIKDGSIISIEEKPKQPKSNYAVIGVYVYDNRVFDMIKDLKPSGRGELEITDVNDAFRKLGELDHRFLKGSWTDAGTFESLYRANDLVRKSRVKSV